MSWLALLPAWNEIQHPILAQITNDDHYQPYRLTTDAPPTLLIQKQLDSILFSKKETNHSLIATMFKIPIFRKHLTVLLSKSTNQLNPHQHHLSKQQ
jgi:hypothetical protein